MPPGSLFTFSIGAVTQRNALFTVSNSVAGEQLAMNDCEQLCPDSNYSIATQITPASYPHMAQNTFTTASPPDVLITKSAPHTTHAFIDDDDITTETDVMMRDYAAKSLFVEVIKRILLGLEGGSGTGGTIISADQILALYDSGNPQVKGFLQDVKNVLSLPAADPLRVTSLSNIADYINVQIGLSSSIHLEATAALIDGILPGRDTPATLGETAPSAIPPFTEARVLVDKMDCPFDDLSIRKILRFDGKTLLADSSEPASYTNSYRFDLEPGDYRVLAASYDAHHSWASSQSNEQYYLSLRDSSENEILRTNITSDIVDTADSVVEILHDTSISTLTIPSSVHSIRAKHQMWPQPKGESHSIAPVCVAFDKIDYVPGDPIVDNQAWAYDLLKAFQLWTGDAAINQCLIPNDGMTSSNLRISPAVMSTGASYDQCTDPVYYNSGAL